MLINNFNTDKEILIIAEIGNNHEGNVSLATEMIKLAAGAGAGAVKFQTIIPNRLVSEKQTERINQLKRFQLSFSDFEKLALVAEKENILFLSTPFDIDCVDFLNSLVPAFKIASGDNNFYPLIEKTVLTKKPIIMSTGLIDEKDLKEILKFVDTTCSRNNIEKQIALLHCVSSYPTSHSDANLLSINLLKKFTQTVGYSDHTIGIDASILSVALGARIIEKHFTIDKNYSNFRDHKLSTDPEELKELVKKVKLADQMMGKEGIVIKNSEIDSVKSYRRSIAVKRNLKAGEKIISDDLIWIRPGTGLPPGLEAKIIDKILKKDIQAGDLINFEDVE